MKRIAVLLFILCLATSAIAQVKATVSPNAPGQRTVTVSWTETTPGVTFKIYRGTTPGGENYSTPLGTAGAGILTYVDTTVVSGQTYYYTVTAYSTVESPPSNEESAVIPTAPASPSQNPAIVN